MKLTWLMFLYFAGFFISTAQAKAGNDHYIEVNVSDTIVLKAAHFVYEVSVGEPSTFPDLRSFSGSGDSIDKDLLLGQLQADIRRAGFTFRLNENDKYTKGKKGSSNKSLFVDLNSKAEMEKLLVLITPMTNIYGKIKSAQYESPAPYYTEMFKRMYAKASQEAGVLAKLTGNTSGKVILITEVKDQGDGYMDMVNKMFKSPMFEGILGGSEIMTKQYIRTFTYRFELN